MTMSFLAALAVLAQTPVQQPQTPVTPPVQTPVVPAPVQTPTTPVATPTEATPAPGPLMTLDQALDIAHTNAFDLKTSESQVRQAQDRVNEARGLLGPKVVLGANYTRFDKAITATTSGGGGGGGTTVIQPIDQKQASAQLTMPIDITGTLGKGVAGARAALNASKANLAATENSLDLDVRTAYYGVLRAAALVGVAQQEVTNAQQAVTTEQQQEAAGVVAHVDVLRLQAQLAQAQSDLITAQTGLALAKEGLNNTIGRPIETPFDVQEPTTLPSVTADENALVQAAEARRPEIQAIEFQKTELRWLTRVQEAGLLPSLNLSANYDRNIDPVGNSRDYTAFATIGLSWPIFDSGVTHARVREAQENERQADIAEQQLQLGVSLQVNQAITGLVNAKSTLDVAQTQVTAAAETYRLAQVQLKAGVGTSLDVSTALTALVQAQQSLANARYNYLTAYAQLQQAVAANDPNAAATGQGTGTK